jgi:hypothetical protein
MQTSMMRSRVVNVQAKFLKKGTSKVSGSGSRKGGVGYR